MQAKELQEKALELQQLQWWLQNPTIKSFFLCVESTSDDEGRYFLEVENRSYHLTTDSDVINDELNSNDEYEMDSYIYDSYMHHDFSTSSYYPVDINAPHYERVYRPYHTDTEIQSRVNHILSTFGGVSVSQTLGNVTGSNITGLVIGSL